MCIHQCMHMRYMPLRTKITIRKFHSTSMCIQWCIHMGHLSLRTKIIVSLHGNIDFIFDDGRPCISSRAKHFSFFPMHKSFMPKGWTVLFRFWNPSFFLGNSFNAKCYRLDFFRIECSTSSKTGSWRCTSCSTVGERWPSGFLGTWLLWSPGLKGSSKWPRGGWIGFFSEI
jgi:hypothetical protein